MQNYIKIYRDVVDKTFCETLIEKFESSKTQQQSWPEGKPFFTQINFSQSIEWKTESETLLNVFKLFQAVYLIFLLILDKNPATLENTSHII